jgi:hypothetical protein
MTLIELMQDFPEINPANYGDDDVNALNAWGIDAHKAIEALQAENERLKGVDRDAKLSAVMFRKDRMAWEAERDTLAAKLAAVEADAERLDWLQAQGFAGLGWVARNSTTGRGYRLHQDAAGCVRARDAIDAAKGGQHEDA